eukprot:1507072-Pyramimonas_sp.AAC.1
MGIEVGGGEGAAAEREGKNSNDENGGNAARKEVKSCMVRGQEKSEVAFSGRTWKNVAEQHRRCEECAEGY